MNLKFTTNNPALLILYKCASTNLGGLNAEAPRPPKHTFAMPDNYRQFPLKGAASAFAHLYQLDYAVNR